MPTIPAQRVMTRPIGTTTKRPQNGAAWSAFLRAFTENAEWQERLREVSGQGKEQGK